MMRGTYKLLIGDCRESMRTLSAGSVHCVCTSPPYWNLRSYATGDSKHLELGSEPTIEAYLAGQLSVFREVKRVLRDDGTLFVNLGDTYSGGGRGGNPADSAFRKQATNVGSLLSPTPDCGLPAGNQCLVPQRFALAMQADGWVLRSTIVWAKRSPMPESLSGWAWKKCRVKINGTGWTKETHPSAKPDEFGRTDTFGSSGDNKPNPHAAKWSDCPGCEKCRDNGGLVLRRGAWRPTNSFEYIFMFAKSMNYFSDSEAVQEVAYQVGRRRSDQFGGAKHNASTSRHSDGSMSFGHETRNPRTVWTMSSEPYKEAHFASFPSELPYRCIRAGTSSAGCCPECGSQYAPVTTSERVPTRPGTNTKVDAGKLARSYANRDDIDPENNWNSSTLAGIVGNRDPQRHVCRRVVSGYRPTCRCESIESVPATVLDPYAGSGTTLQVATWLGRNAIGCELSDEYAKLAHARIATKPRCLVRRERPTKPAVVPLAGQRSLFEESVIELVNDGHKRQLFSSEAP